MIQLWQNAEKKPTDMMINSLKFAENINWRKGWECRFGLEVALAGPENPNGNRSLEGPT